MKKILRYFLISYFTLCFIFIMFIIIKNFFDETPDLTKTIDIVSLGANGSDEEDDTIFLQNALDQAKKELIDNSKILVKVIVPEGTYYVNQTLLIYSNTYLLLDKNANIIFNGKGNVLKASYVDLSGNICLPTDTTRLDGGLSEECNIGKYKQWKNITIEGGIWDYNKNKSMVLLHGDNLTIKNTILKNSSTHALNVSGTKDTIIENVVFKDQITSNKLGSINEVLHLDSTDIAGEPSAFPLDGTPVKNVLIQNCTFENVLSGIGSHTLYTKEEEIGTNITIRNNIFKDIKYIAINLFAHNNVLIYNNEANGANKSYAFLHTYYTGAKVYNNKVDNFTSKLIVGANESYENPYELEIDNDLANSVEQMYFFIKYKPNKGKGKMQNTIVNYGTATKIAKNKYTKNGYNFIGWKAHRLYRDDYFCDCNGVGCWLTLKEKKEQNREFKLFEDEAMVVKTISRHKETVEFIAQWKKIKKVEVLKKPYKLNYYQSNTTLDLTGGTLKIIYDDDTIDVVDMKESTVIPFNSSVIGEKEVTLSYAGVKAKLKINILPIQTNFINIKSLPNKIIYLVGEKLDLTGLSIEAINNDGSVVVTDKDYIVSANPIENVGTQVVTIIYGGKSVSFNIAVVEDEKLIKYNNKNIKILNEMEIDNGKKIEKKNPMLGEIIIAVSGIVILIAIKTIKYFKRKELK